MMNKLQFWIIFFLMLSIPPGTINDSFAWESANISDIRFATHKDYTRVVFELETNLPYRINRDDSGNVIVDFPSGIISPAVSSSKNTIIKVKDNVIENIEVNKIGKGVRTKIILGKRAGPYKTSLLQKPYRLVMDIQSSPAIHAGAGKKDQRIDVVIIDAGHGGKDPGAIGRRGLREKIVTLDIARRVEKSLKRAGKVKIILTRQSDEFISLDTRVNIANKKSGALFVSIHTNSHLNKNAGGFETFYLGEAKTDEAKAVAMLENSVLELEERPFLSDMGRELNKILWDLRLNEFKIESRELAAIIQENMNKRINLTNRGIKGGLFYVLRGAAMPAVLVETAFISNPKEEALLRRSSFREVLAQAVSTSILQYKDRFEKTGGFTE